MGGKVGENPAALRTAVFFAILENPEGGGAFKRPPPPPAGRGLMQQFNEFHQQQSTITMRYHFHNKQFAK